MSACNWQAVRRQDIGTGANYTLDFLQPDIRASASDQNRSPCWRVITIFAKFRYGGLTSQIFFFSGTLADLLLRPGDRR